MQGEHIDQPGERKDPQHLLLRRGEQQLTPGPPGQVPPAHQRCQAAGIDELQARQIHDDLRLAGRDRREPGRDTGGLCYVKLSAQRDDSLAVSFADNQIHTSHRTAFLLQQQGGVLTQRLINQLSLPTLRRLPAGVPSG